MKIRRRSKDGIQAELFGLNTQQNDTREVLRIQTSNLRSARGWLKELRDNAPTPHLSINKSFPLAEFNDALRSARISLNKLRKRKNKKLQFNRPVPRTRGKINPAILLDTITGSLDIIGQITNALDTKQHAKLVANQKRIVSELEQQVDALEKQDREIEAQKGEKGREKKLLRPE